MNFSEFAHRLSDNIGLGGSTSKFTRSLFEMVVKDDYLCVIDEIKDSSFKSYYNGKVGIYGISDKIASHIDTNNFIEFVMNEFSDIAREGLCDSFRNEIPDIDGFNCEKKLQHCFVI